MIIQEVRTIDELLHFVEGLCKEHGLRLWYRGDENASLSLIPSIHQQLPVVCYCSATIVIYFIFSVDI